METNINSDLGEKSQHSSTANDPALLAIINTANVACGYHAGDQETIENTIQIAKKNNVTIGSHPSFKDRENFGRKRLNLPGSEIRKIIIEQLEIMAIACDKNSYKSTHVKPHGALNNMACEDYDLALTIANAIKEFDRNLIFMVLAQSEMEKAAINLNMPYASEIFADRNYEDNATLISRTLNHALITDPQISLRNVMRMLQEKSIISYSGKKIPCNIDTICLHGDGKTAVSLAKFLREGLEKNGFILKPLDQLGKFQ